MSYGSAVFFTFLMTYLRFYLNRDEKDVQFGSESSSFAKVYIQSLDDLTVKSKPK